MRFIALLAFMLCSNSLAQTDSCANPTPISGFNTWGFDTSTFTTSQFDGSGCQYSDAAIHKDGFFLWQSSVEGAVAFDTFGSGFDTRLRVHRGSDCSALCQDHNDDGGNLQSSLLIHDVALGEGFLIQVGGFGNESGQAILNIGPRGCVSGLGDGFENNDSPASASVLVVGTYEGLSFDSTDPDYFTLSIPAGYRALISIGSSPFSQATQLSDTNGLVLPPTSSASNAKHWRVSNSNSNPLPLQLAVESTSSQCRSYNLRFSMELDDCFMRPDDGFEDNDTCATPTQLLPGTYKNLLGSFFDPDVYEVVVPPGMALTVFGDMPGLPDGLSGYTGPGFMACGFPNTQAHFQYGYLHHVNATTFAQPVLFVVQPPIHPGPRCYSYDLNVHLDPDACAMAPRDHFDLSGQTWAEDGMHPGLFIDRHRPDSYDLCVPAGGTVFIDALFSHSEGDISLWLMGASGESVNSDTDNEHLSWTNPTNVDRHVRLYVQLASPQAAECTNYDLVIQGTCDCHDQVGTHFCDQPFYPAGFNSQPFADLRCGAQGSGLQLKFNSGPPNMYGIVLMASEAASSGITIGQGTLCLTGSVTRFSQPGATNSTGIFDSNGSFMSLSGNGDSSGYGFEVPSGSPYGGTLISAGDTMHFQLWYRLPGGTSRFSSALSVTF